MSKEEIKKLAEKVLEDGFVMSLGTLDEGGVWVADVIYIHDEDLNLYWLSFPHHRHSKAIEKNKKIACTITTSWETDKERALQIEGLAKKIEGPLFEYEKKLASKRGMRTPEVAGKVLEDGHSWYIIEPTKIELIHNEPFGYKKQIVDLE